ncbi:MAG: flagellar protein FlgN [Deferribacteraceae bacterium]|jgi:butyrate kinase|nr:flagellar protein FlgN [Deferribacteraceae bacterium]
MESLKHLVEVLKSQLSLYSEIKENIELEKQAIVSWSVGKTAELTKIKEELLRREKIQVEARNLLISQIAKEAGKESLSIAGVIDYAKGTPQAAQLETLCQRLVALITQIQAENLSLRVLYATNSRMINDFLTQIGLSEPSYGSASPRKTSTISKVG